MDVVDIKQFKSIIDAGVRRASAKYEGVPISFYFTKAKVGYGWRHYFRCPHCGKNRSKLVFDRTIFRCVDCAKQKPYRGIQTTTRGVDVFIMYKMNRYAQRHGITIKPPFDYHDYVRPKGRWSKHWERDLKILQALENMRFQTILFHKIWDAETIGQRKYKKMLNFYDQGRKNESKTLLLLARQQL